MSGRLSRIGESLQDYIDRKESNQQLAFERKVVRKILLGTGLSQEGLKLVQSSQGGEDYVLTFAWFFEMHPSFPVFLNSKINWQIDFNDFIFTSRGKFWREWGDICSSLTECSSPFGLAFGMDGATSGETLMVSHNADLPFANSAGELRHFQRLWVDEGEVNRKVTIEPLSCFVSRISQIWQAV